jgi:hypothetical protein
MRTMVRKFVPVAAAAVVLTAAGAANAGCVTKASYGTASSLDSAKTQAWEAILQATNWGSWAQFMAGGMKLGNAPGYKVSGLRFDCKPGGYGYECKGRAQLCD